MKCFYTINTQTTTKTLAKLQSSKTLSNSSHLKKKMKDQKERKRNHISSVKLLTLLQVNVFPVFSLYEFGIQVPPKFGNRRKTNFLNTNFKIKRKYTEL